MPRRGLMLILSSPSGAGKTTLSRLLLASDPALALSISATTRAMRPGEVDGRDYHFIDHPRFAAMVADNAFLEWAEVFGNRYGTPRASVEADLAAGRDVLFDVDWQGCQQLHQAMPRDVVRVFILPPSLPELQRRLAGRGTDSAEVVAARMARAQAEISHWSEYDYVVVNDDLDTCHARLVQILAAERLRRERQTALVGFVRGLMQPA